MSEHQHLRTWRRGCALLFCMVFAGFEATAADQRVVSDALYETAQRLVPVDEGRRLNLVCTGSGQPLVVFGAGLGDSSKSWGLVQPEVARRSRTCAYDRAGLGFSNGSEAERTAQFAVADLQSLLRTAGVAPPYLLVGHSYGGMIVKLYAFQHPHEVAGLVLVDPSHEDVGRELFALDPESLSKNLSYLASLSQCLTADNQINAAMQDFASLCVGDAGPRYGDAIRSADRVLARTPVRIAAWSSEMRNVWRASADQVRAAQTSLGTMPLVVLSKTPSQPAPGESQDLRDAKNRILLGQHQATAQLSRVGKHQTVKDAGHYIQLDQPRVVIASILEVLNTLRRREAKAASSAK